MVAVDINDPFLQLFVQSTIFVFSSQSFVKSVWRNSDMLSCPSLRSVMKFRGISLSLVLGKNPSWQSGSASVFFSSIPLFVGLRSSLVKCESVSTDDAASVAKSSMVFLSFLDLSDWFSFAFFLKIEFQ